MIRPGGIGVKRLALPCVDGGLLLSHTAGQDQVAIRGRYFFPETRLSDPPH